LAPPPNQSPPGGTADVTGRPHVLLVDDEPAVRRILGMALARGGLGVRLAASGREAVEVYRDQWRAIDLVLLDVLMPGGLDGVDTLAALREINPGVRCCFMSGDTGCYPVHKLLAMGAVDVLFKPFADLSGLRQTLWELALVRGR
jgi:CheY-like chemotaxis protein